MNSSLFKSQTIFLKRLLPFIALIALMSYRYTNYSVQSKKCYHSKPVEVITPTVKWGESIRVIANGTYRTTGNCTPTLLTGWLKLNQDNAWDTLQRIQDRGILMCGFSQGVWRNDTLELSTFIMNCNLGLTKELPQGTFKFTYYRGRFKRFKMAVSSAIEIYL